MARWEYRTLYVKTVAGTGLMGKVQFDTKAIDTELGAAGRDGWELVSSVALNVLDGQTAYVLYTLKRPAA